MADMKFKIGDKVLIKGDYDDATDHLDGKIGKVVKVNSYDIEVSVKGEPFTWLIWNHNAEHVIEETGEIVVDGFKVGDRVKVDGMSGTIICISMGDLFGVQFDDENYQGHRCIGVKLKAGNPSRTENCWWVNSKNLVKIETSKYYNGKVVCVMADDPAFTVGKIYTFSDGTVVDNNDTVRYRGIEIRDLSEIKRIWKFIPLVE